jgi:hypothetical protein
MQHIFLFFMPLQSEKKAQTESIKKNWLPFEK